ncbi:MAG: transcription antitermination factor NusB [Pseudomonadota bacterium]
MAQKTTNKSARHSARIALVQALYQYEQTKANTTAIAREFIDHRFDKTDQESSYFSPDQSYFQKLIEAIPLKITEIDEEIQKYLQENWKMDRLAAVVRSLLRSACYELMFEPLVPTPVVLNEYIEVAREFLDEREVKFVNGILDNIAKSVRT